jgi:hypothetical protein
LRREDEVDSEKNKARIVVVESGSRHRLRPGDWTGICLNIEAVCK